MSVLGATSDVNPVFPAIIVVFFVAFFALHVLSMVLWIVKIVEVARLDDSQYRAAGSEKTNWILVVVLAGVIGAIIWQFSGARKRVKAAPVLTAMSQVLYSGLVPPAWYPDPTDPSQVRWWNGAAWTEHRYPSGAGPSM
jgi:TctA family transporter